MFLARSYNEGPCAPFRRYSITRCSGRCELEAAESSRSKNCKGIDMYTSAVLITHPKCLIPPSLSFSLFGVDKYQEFLVIACVLSAGPSLPEEGSKRPSVVASRTCSTDCTHSLGSAAAPVNTCWWWQGGPRVTSKIVWGGWPVIHRPLELRAFCWRWDCWCWRNVLRVSSLVTWVDRRGGRCNEGKLGKHAIKDVPYTLASRLYVRVYTVFLPGVEPAEAPFERVLGPAVFGFGALANLHQVKRRAG